MTASEGIRGSDTVVHKNRFAMLSYRKNQSLPLLAFSQMFKRINSIASLFAVLCALPMLPVSRAVYAAEWSVEPSVRVRREYNDNITMTTQPHKSVNGNLVMPKVEMASRTEAWQINGTAEITRRRYPGESSLDRDDNTFKLASQYATERDTWRLEGNRTFDSVLSEEVSADTGVVQIQKRRKTHGVSPEWTRMLTDRTQMQLTYNLSDTSYVNGESAGLYDYRYSVASLRLSHRTSERNQVFATGAYSAFHVPATGFDSISRLFQAGAGRNFSETLQGSLTAGVRKTESLTRGTPTYEFDFLNITFVQTGVTPDIRREETSTTFNASVEKKFENSSVSLTANRSLYPSGSGGQVEQDSFDFRWNRPLTSRFRVSLNAYTHKTRTDEGNILNNDRMYYYVEPSANWQMSREWAMNASYRYTHLKRAYEATAATANAVYLTLVYYPLKMSISH